MAVTINKLFATAGAAGLGVLLLAGSGMTLAGWEASRPLGQGTVTTGRISVASTPVTYDYAHVDFVPGATSVTQTSTTSSTSLPSMPGPLVPGDTVTVKTTVTLTMQGNNAKASLSVNPAALVGEANLTGELAAGGAGSVIMTPLGSTKPLGAPTGQNRWTVDRTYDGAQYTASITLKVRATKDGAPPNPSAPATTGNWWGATLQGASASSRSIAITLDQVL